MLLSPLPKSNFSFRFRSILNKSHCVRFVHSQNLKEHHQRLANSAFFLFKSAGITIKKLNSNLPVTPTNDPSIASILSSPEANNTARWRISDAVLWKLPDSVEGASTDSPGWFKMPLNDIILPKRIIDEGLLPGVNYTHSDLDLQISTLKKLRECSQNVVTNFTTNLGRVLVDDPGKESVVVPLASDLLTISGFGSRGWVTTGPPGMEKIESEFSIGDEKWVLVANPHFLIWKNFEILRKELVGTMFCEVRRKGGSLWAQILGELLAVASFRASCGLFNPDGSVSSYLISIGGPSVRIVSGCFPVDYFVKITADLKVDSPVVECWPKNKPKNLLIESERKEIFQALTRLREHLEEPRGEE